MNARELIRQAERDAATPLADWLTAHAAHGPVVTQSTGVNGAGQVRVLHVCPCGATYAQRSER